MAEHIQIFIQETKEVISGKPEHTVLWSLQRAGVLPELQGCYGGGCGACKVQIVAGNYVEIKKMSRAHISLAEEASTYVLLCCIKPLSDITISIKKE